MEDTSSQTELERNRDLLGLRKHLDKIKWYEAKVAAFKAVLDDPKQHKRRPWAKRCTKIAERAIAVHKEITEVIMEMIRLRGEKIDIQKQLEALED